MSRLCLPLALAALATVSHLLSGCAARRAQGDDGAEVEESVGIEAAPDADQLGWVEVPDGLVEDPESGLSFVLPEGWFVREGGGDLVFEVRDPEGTVFFRLRRWDGWVDGLVALHQAAEGAFLHQGPYSGLERVADAPPWVGTRVQDGEEQGLLFGWYFLVDEVGVELEAELPQHSFEERWRDVDGILRSARTGRHGASSRGPQAVLESEIRP